MPKAIVTGWLHKLCAALAIALLVLQPMGQRAEAVELPEAPLIFSGKETLQEMIEKFRAALSSLIAQAGSESRTVLAFAFQLADMLVQNLEQAYANSLKLTFAELDQQQQRAVTDASKALEKLRLALKEPLTTAERVTEDLTASIDNFASLWATKPMVVRYGPTYVPPARFGEFITVSVFGRNLAHGKIKLASGNITAEVLENTPRALTFRVPRSVFPTLTTGFADASLKLTLIEPGFWSDRPLVYYLRLIVLPEKLGTYVVKQNIPRVRVERTPWVSQEVVAGYTPTKDNLIVNECLPPPNGWSFVPTTAKAAITRKLARWGGGQDNRYWDGAATILENRRFANQICVQVLARPTESPVRTLTAAVLKVDIVQTVTTDELLTQSGEIRWEEDEVYTHPAEARASHLTLTMLDGIVYKETGIPSLEHRFLQISPDMRSGTVTLRPKRPWMN